jgi:hypothetical protein
MTNEISNQSIIEINNINDIECPICFYNIEENDGILIMDCCKYKVHLTCLVDWYTKHPENNVCFMCNQINQFCIDLVLMNQIETNISDESNILDESNISNIFNHQRTSVRHMYYIGPILCWLIITVVIIIYII